MSRDSFQRLIARSAGFLAGLHPGWVWAAEGNANWRPTYDTAMLWVNFVILVVVLIKFLRPPARKFLSTYKANLEAEFNKLTAEKEKAANDLQVFKENLQDRRRIWENRHQKILAQGERDRQALIEDGRAQAHRLMDSANRQIEARVREAGRQLKGEIVDKAIDMALAELPKQMTPGIQSQWLDHFLSAVQSGHRKR